MGAGGLPQNGVGHEQVPDAPREVCRGEQDRERRAEARERRGDERRRHENCRGKKRGELGRPRDDGAADGRVEKRVLEAEADANAGDKQLKCSRVHELVHGQRRE